MSHMLIDITLFFLKAIITIATILIIVASTLGIATKNKKSEKGKLRIINLNKKLQETKEKIHETILNKSELKLLKKSNKKQSELTKRMFLIDFNGDMKASAVENLREEITSILTIATPQDEVVIRLESPGGLVNAYGLAASQLQRIKDHKIPLTVAIDKVAASGGYLMAIVADKIIAAPFAIIGSIGVVMQLPNFNKFLKKHDIDFEMLTAGKYKRTLTILGENNQEGRDKSQEDLDEVHTLFKNFITDHRDNIDIEKVATGEYWFGSKAIEYKLIDELKTSDDYILEASSQANIYKISYTVKKSKFCKMKSESANIFLKFIHGVLN